MTFQNPDASFENEWGWPPVQVVAPLTGTTVPVPSSTRHLYVNPVGALAALTVKLPPSPEKFAFVDIAFSQAVTALTIQNSAGVTVPGSSTAGAAGTNTMVRWLGGTLGWVKWR